MMAMCDSWVDYLCDKCIQELDDIENNPTLTEAEKDEAYHKWKPCEKCQQTLDELGL